MRIQKLIEQIMAYPDDVKIEYYVTPWEGEDFRNVTFYNKDDVIGFLFDKDIHNWEVGYISMDEMDYPKGKELGMAIRLKRVV